MINFRCWYCNRYYSVPEQRIGERISCSCKNVLRIPKRNGGNCRVKTLADWVIEAVLYGGGGALVGFGLGALIVSQIGLVRQRFGWLLIPALTLVGFLAGFLGGERGMSWLGRMIRERERD